MSNTLGTGKRVAGKVAIVTGAAGGMGASHARTLAAEGAAVAVCDIAEAAGQRLADDIAAAGGQARFYKLDVSSQDNWALVLEQVESDFGTPNIVVNNAGTGTFQPVHETSVEDWDRVYAINATGAFLGCKMSYPYMQKAGGGSIVNVGSNSVFRAFGGVASYVASKGAIRSLTKSAAADFIKANIRVNCIHPGIIPTELTRDNLENPDFRKTFVDACPMQRPGTVEEVSGVVLFLASDESTFVVGSDWTVDGGFIGTV